ncbi:hypothetical protein TVAG_182570 [Trichomonas vaginalis G3]|uniref:Uncharacterized protein n=1 Tax=Trichomonas vaginalis (strain ATCC PRA-98 / G3) TaxID=412133 RepID=A2D8Z5_TRIV3|nr:spectrin binding [Trichomonas vaginalis G3]EAY23021.1 hypothetical protein TVAG_182570 [Trichomonas vaginalis G3]KAI5518984.1 spectrin binding [Trichomonas vaginalis G3]|eukprot:XP_001584007.1 hypothetical protein [Trichomonas vaginalis G3]
MNQGITSNSEYIAAYKLILKDKEATINHSNDIVEVYNFLADLSENGNHEMMAKACEDGLWKKESNDTFNILHLACRNGIFQLVNSLILCGCDKESQTKYGYTPLIIASCFGKLEIVKYLISIGADKEAKDKYGYTPLIIASGNGHLEVVKYLISIGADKEARNNDEYTPLNCASIKGHEEIVKYLISVGANKEAKYYERKTALTVVKDNVRNYLSSWIKNTLDSI